MVEQMAPRTAAWGGTLVALLSDDKPRLLKPSDQHLERGGGCLRIGDRRHHLALGASGTRHHRQRDRATGAGSARSHAVPGVPRRKGAANAGGAAWKPFACSHSRMAASFVGFLTQAAKNTRMAIPVTVAALPSEVDAGRLIVDPAMLRVGGFGSAGVLQAVSRKAEPATRGVIQEEAV